MKVAIITGAARGIGAAMARAFAEDGYGLALIDILDTELRSLAAELTELGYNVEAFTSDLENLDELESTVGTISDRFGRIDVLINNAAISIISPLQTVNLEEWNRVIAVNLTAPAFMSKWVVPHMQKNRGGVIINVASIEATAPKGVAAAYAAAKGGLLSLTFDSAASLIGSGIRVVALSPGAVDTEMGTAFDRAAPDADPDLDADVRVTSEEFIPMKRWAQPSEIAKVAVWLASDSASYVTATEITVDGGLSRSWMPRRLKNRIAPGYFE
jgi:NAD(P)-dependent dehydrogenase (short-subunit alcohol dehydrogenase family)